MASVDKPWVALTAAEEAIIRRHAADEPWQLPDRINTVRHLVRQLLATIDASRSTLTIEERRLAEYALRVSEGRQRNQIYPTPEAEHIYGTDMVRGLDILNHILGESR